ncbi:hypothetical protein ABK040_011465 [Willaertia magna]
MQPKTYNPLDPILSVNPEAKEQSVVLSSILVRGLEKTKDVMIKKAFKEATEAKSLEELNQAISVGLERSRKLGVLSHMNVVLDSDNNNNVVMVLDCKETSSKRFSIGSTVNDKGQAKGEVSFGYRNLIGYADTWDLDTNFDKSGLTLIGRAVFPQSFNRNGSLQLSTYLMGSRRLTNYLQEKSNGISVRAQINDRHTLSYDFEVRTNEDVNALFRKSTSNNFISRWFNTKSTTNENQEEEEDKSIKSQLWNEVREKSIKSSLSHTYKLDLRDNFVTPTSGLNLKLIQSIAGLSGDVKHYSFDLNSEVFIPLYKNLLVGSLQLNTGVVIPLDREKDTFISLNDRFIDQVRGFPEVGEVHPLTLEPLGGNVKAIATGRLYFPFPITLLRDLFGLHCQVFCDVGNVANIRDYSSNGIKEFKQSFINGLHCSYGVGLALMLSFGRLEFNFAKPSNVLNDRVHLPSTFNNFKQFSFRFVYNE